MFKSSKKYFPIPTLPNAPIEVSLGKNPKRASRKSMEPFIKRVSKAQSNRPLFSNVRGFNEVIGRQLADGKNIKKVEFDLARISPPSRFA